eukprot:151658_1
MGTCTTQVYSSYNQIQINMDTKEGNDYELYHEKQQWEMCLLHSINSLLQKHEFTSKQLNSICKELSPNKLINPHRSMFKTGNYDANVLIMALNKMNIDVQWFDTRKAKELDLNDEIFLKFLQPDNQRLVGFILNNPLKKIKMLKRRHWIAIKKINDKWYNLDSKLKQPKGYGNVDELNVFLRNCLIQNNAELMICRAKKSNKQVGRNVTLRW